MFGSYSVSVPSAPLGYFLKSSLAEERSSSIYFRGASMSPELSRLSSTSSGDASRRTYSSCITSLRCVPSPRRWMMYSRSFSSCHEGYGPKRVSRKDRFRSAPSRRGRLTVEIEPSG
jgi:hypothetical protein